MKSDVENLSETRVRFTVELPFEELDDAVTSAYRRISQQVQIPGFRKGKVPRAIIDQRFGRAAVLEEVVQERIPDAYEQVIRDAGVFALGQPQVEVTDVIDGERIAFTAEVDIRPDFELPEYKGRKVEVEALTVTDEDVAEQLDSLRARFGSYAEVDRAAATGDVLLIDLAADHDGRRVDDLTQQAMSYDIGTDGVLPGLDDAVTGRSKGESTTFEFTPEFGEFRGKPISVTVTVQAVRERVLPALDDDLAIVASEFDTLEELRADLRTRLERARLLESGSNARERLHQMLLDELDIPLPQSIIDAEVASHFENHGDHDDDHRAEVESDARKSLKSQFLMDRIADAEEIGVGEAELSQWLMMQAPRYGMSPDQFANSLVEAGQVPMAVSEVRRSKALAFVLEQAEIVDSNGTPIDLAQIDRLLREESSSVIEEIDAMSEEEGAQEADESTVGNAG